MIKFSEPFRSPAWVLKLLKNKSHVSQSPGRGESWQGKPLLCLSRMRGQRKGKFTTNSHSSTQGKFQLLQEAPSDHTQLQWPRPSPRRPHPSLASYMLQAHGTDTCSGIRDLGSNPDSAISCMPFIKSSALLTCKMVVIMPRPLTQPK